MHDIRWILENPEHFDGLMARRGLGPLSHEIAKMDAARKACVARLQELQSERNLVAKEIGARMAKKEDATALMARATELKEIIPALEVEEKEASETLFNYVAALPNSLDADVPAGNSEADNVVRITWGDIPSYDFTPKSHYDLGEGLGLMDFEAAAKLAGARFVVLKGALARLERALTSFMLDHHASAYGYTPVSPPYLVRSACMFGTGQLPKFADDSFSTTDGRWLIPTSEISLTNLVREETLDPSALPMRYVAATPCFRSEAGAAGRDTRGMIRQHQFHKVELVSIVHPDASKEEHERMLTAAQSVLQALKLPYRVVTLCQGDTGATARKTYDIEVWLPGDNVYREISSCSNTGSYQARRMETRLKEKDERGALKYPHTLNGSGVAVGRALVAVLENYQQADGSILVPEVLRPYMGGQERITHGQN